MGDGQLITFMGVGLIAGLLFCKFVQGHGLGVVGSVFIGFAGATIFGSILPYLGMSLGTGYLAPALHGTIGAVLLLSLSRVFEKQ